MALPGNQAATFRARQKGMLPGELALEWEWVAQGEARGRFTVLWPR